MGRIVNSLLFRIAASAVLINLVLGPLLYMQVIRILEASHVESFVSDVRSYTTWLAEMLEFEIDSWSRSELIDFLDLVVVSRNAVYASLAGAQGNIGTLYGNNEDLSYVEDFTFGEHGDETYFLSVPLESQRYGHLALRLGLDEGPTLESLEEVKRRVVVVLFFFMGLSVVFAVALGLVITRPLHYLRRASLAIAAGNLDESFDVNTRMTEIVELSRDLGAMRAHLVQANRRLRREIAERKDLERDRVRLESTLRHSQRLETIGTLAGGIAHEFNNLLLPMKFYTETAIEDLPPESQMRSDLEKVARSIDRAKRIVQQVLTFSRKAPDDRFAPISVGEIVADIVNIGKDIFPSSIELKSDVEPGLPQVLGDETQIHQVIMNLCTNAVQSMEGRSGVLAISVCRVRRDQSGLGEQLAAGDYIRIDVADQGIGMDRLTVDRIFEPFYSERNATGGTGLGLTVAHGIIVAHGGEIVVTSTKGSGSVMSVYLPVGEQFYKGPGTIGRIIYIGTREALEPYTSLTGSANGTRRVVTSPDELEAELMAVAAAEDAYVVLIVDDDDFNAALSARSDIFEMLLARHVLVVLTSVSVLSNERMDWARLHCVVGPITPFDLRILISQSAQRDEETSHNR